MHIALVSVQIALGKHPVYSIGVSDIDLFQYLLQLLHTICRQLANWYVRDMLKRLSIMRNNCQNPFIAGYGLDEAPSHSPFHLHFLGWR